MMTIAEVLKDVDNRIEAEIILSYVLGKPRPYLVGHKFDMISDKCYSKYTKLINELQKGVPIQYIIGKQDFMGYSFKVNKNVLIPRGDTEVLVQEVIDYITKNKLCKPKILDLCTGSGCIGISIARLVKDATVTATDISELALEVAKSNGVGVKNIEFIKSDMFNNIPESYKFDIIISNPPYIETGVIPTLESKVKDYEPKLALDGGKDGLNFYTKILSNSNKYLNKNGVVFLEIGYLQANNLETLYKNEHKYCDFNVVKDLNDNDRVVYFKLK